MVDAPVRTYDNVLFHDNYWQNLNVIASGEAVGGAYVRQLVDLTGGYGSITASHSDVHLWYHGTIDYRTPASDTVAFVTASERLRWWTEAEDSGASAGFHFSLIGRGDRLGENRPSGPGGSRVKDGFNQLWDLGGGTAINRTRLDSNSGEWPNIMRMNMTSTNLVAFGQNIVLKLYYQWARSVGSSAQVEFYVDDDFNPFNDNGHLLLSATAASAGVSNIRIATANVPVTNLVAEVGWHSIFAKISGGGRTRYIYTPELVQIVPTFEQPRLAMGATASGGIFVEVIGQTGQIVTVDRSTNLVDWEPLSTNQLTAKQWILDLPHTAAKPYEFFRGRLGR